MATSLRVEEVIDALNELGGEAPWAEIQRRVTTNRGDSYAPYLDWNNFDKTMFQLVQKHCHGYAKFTGPVHFNKTSRGFSLAITRQSIPPELIHAETVPSNREYITGAVRQVLVNAYERNPSARLACIKKHGASCMVCGLNFESVYGAIGHGFIHVHHKRQLSSREVYQLDPVADLVPVCPNCHAMLHTSDPPLSVDELIDFMASARRGRS